MFKQNKNLALLGILYSVCSKLTDSVSIKLPTTIAYSVIDRCL